MKTYPIQKEHCTRYPLEYITASIKEHGVDFPWNGSVEKYKEEEKIFWLALRDNADNDNCFAFALHNFPSILKADPQWGIHTTRLWDSVVDVCNGGFPGGNHKDHFKLVVQSLPVLTNEHKMAFKEHIFNTWSPAQWANFFEYINDSSLNTVQIWEDIQNLTDHNMLDYICDTILSWCDNHDVKRLEHLSQTPLGQKSIEYIKDNINTALPCLLDKCGAFRETSYQFHGSVYLLNQYIPLPLDETTKKCVASSLLYWAGSVSARRFNEMPAQEYQWMKGLWNGLSNSTKIDVYKKHLVGYWVMAVKGVERLLECGFDVDHLCSIIEKDFGEELSAEKYPHINAHLQAKRIQSEIPKVEHEKLRKL